ncbi:hypothetical protein LzC2_39890 [Planctomycetes bacterium LzC2]|uniref:Uncharacterized protein n=1 Tax=Alienimonas chondri TaxID=2681879 RepID=A0ABX1VID8_9PLAN|nr:hypothetical protein [Alienimonas chondri]
MANVQESSGGAGLAAPSKNTSARFSPASSRSAAAANRFGPAPPALPADSRNASPSGVPASVSSESKWAQLDHRSSLRTRRTPGSQPSNRPPVSHANSTAAATAAAGASQSQAEPSCPMRSNSRTDPETSAPACRRMFASGPAASGRNQAASAAAAPITASGPINAAPSSARSSETMRDRSATRASASPGRPERTPLSNTARIAAGAGPRSSA